MRSVEPAQLQTLHRGQDLQRGALRIGDTVALGRERVFLQQIDFALFEILVHGMVLAQRLAFQQGVEPDHLRTVGVGLHGSRGNGLQPQIAVVCDAVVKDFAGHALHAKMLGDGDLIGPIGVFEGFLKQLFFGFEVVKEAGFGDVLSLGHIAYGEAPETELGDE